MAAPPLDAKVRQLDGIGIVDLHGEINAQGEEILDRAYVEATSQNPSTVLLNFADVDYINSTGIALIVGLLTQARKAGRKMFACGLSSHYMEIFKITRLSDFMSIYPDEASALASVQQARAT